MDGSIEFGYYKYIYIYWRKVLEFFVSSTNPVDSKRGDSSNLIWQFWDFEWYPSPLCIKTFFDLRQVHISSFSTPGCLCRPNINSAWLHRSPFELSRFAVKLQVLGFIFIKKVVFNIQTSGTISREINSPVDSTQPDRCSPNWTSRGRLMPLIPSWIGEK